MLLNSDVEEVDKEGKITKSTSKGSSDGKKSSPKTDPEDQTYKSKVGKLRNTLIMMDDLDSKQDPIEIINEEKDKTYNLLRKQSTTYKEGYFKETLIKA